MVNPANDFDYALLQKEVLLQLKGALESESATKEYLINLVDTALDYGFYLSDERVK
jgi:hypothetical protein